MMNKKLTAFATTFALVALYSVSAMAQGAQASADNIFTTYGWMALSAGLGIGIAAFGGALGQGRAATAALEGIARNPSASGKLFTPLILGLALIESLVIYAFVITILIVLNINVSPENLGQLIR